MRFPFEFLHQNVDHNFYSQTKLFSWVCPRAPRKVGNSYLGLATASMSSSSSSHSAIAHLICKLYLIGLRDNSLCGLLWLGTRSLYYYRLVTGFTL